MPSITRRVNRIHLKEKYKAMKTKKKALEIVLEDGETKVVVHAPTMGQFTEYLESFAVIQQIGRAFGSIQSLAGGGPIDLGQVRIDKQTMEGFYPLLAMLSNITVEEYKELSVNDGMAIMFAYVQLLAPETMANPTAAEETQPPQPTTAQQP